MRNRSISILALIFLAGSILTLVASHQGWFLRGEANDCSANDKKLIPNLVSQKILSTHPSGATKSGGDYSGCNSDDSYAYAGSSYIFSGSFAEVLSFYGAAAEKDGWQPVSEATSLETKKKNHCFRKSIDADTAYFSIRLLERQEKGKDIKFYVAVSSSREEAPADGGILC